MISATNMLASLPRIGGYVFSMDGKTHVAGFSRLKVALDKTLTEAGTNIEPWRVHDLRRSVATDLGELGFPPHVIDMTLNHISGEKVEVGGIYSRSRYMPDCRRALTAWARSVYPSRPGTCRAPLTLPTCCAS